MSDTRLLKQNDIRISAQLLCHFAFLLSSREWDLVPQVFPLPCLVRVRVRSWVSRVRG